MKSMPNGRWLYDNKIVTNLSQDQEKLEKQIQQIGIDLTVAQIYRVDGVPEVSFFDKKLPKPHLVNLQKSNDDKLDHWHLNRGWYEVVFNEGCKIPSDLALLIRQRSTLLRSGVILHSSVFDPGYECDNIGTVIHVRNQQGIVIYPGARLAQIYAHPCMKVQTDDLYGSLSKGSSYQNEKNLNK